MCYPKWLWYPYTIGKSSSKLAQLPWSRTETSDAVELPGDNEYEWWGCSANAGGGKVAVTGLGRALIVSALSNTVKIHCL